MAKYYAVTILVMIAPEHLAQMWGIGIKKAKETLGVTT
jgi:hypothetical protein